MTPPRWLSDLEQLERAATPGPWEENTDGPSSIIKSRCRDHKGTIPCFNYVCEGAARPDRELILHVRNGLPQILRALRAATEMREAWKVHDEHSSWCDCLGDPQPAITAFDAAMAGDGEPTLRDAEKEGK